ncbi:MAG: hypothetical protein KDC46_05860 [Thermoleophilia bacterium]|nr:hypothetical protein [Thermoleophilia bacterium]
MREMSVSQFKATCLARFEEIANGGEGVVVTKRGVPIAQVGPVQGSAARPRVLGRLAGTLQLREDLAAAPAAPDDSAADSEQELLDEWRELNA